MSRKFYNLQTTNARNVFNGNGVTQVFTTDFAFIASASLEVTLVSSAGVETAQVLNTNYTVSGGLNSQGNPDVGSVTMLVAPPTGSRLVVERIEPYVQPSTFQRFGGISIKVVELALDRLTLLSQQLLDLTARTLRYPSSEPLATNGTLPSLDDRKGKLLKFNATTGAPEATAVAGAGTEISAAMLPVIAAVNVAAARVLLGADFGVTVTSFGADKTGVADSTAAFQSAVDSGAGIVFVPGGNYKLLGTVTITAPVKIIGAGGDFNVSAGGGSDIGFGDGSNDFFVINSNNVTLEGLNFHGDGGGNRATTGARAIVVGKDTVSLTAKLAITSGTAADVGTGTAFATGDIGKRMVIVGAGAAGEPLVTTISAVADATHLTVADNAGTTVAAADGHYGHAYIGTRLIGVTTNTFHDAGVHFVSAAHFEISGGWIRGTNAAAKIENRVGPDYGDSMIHDVVFSTAAGGKAVHWLSSGGLKVVNNKFLDAAYHLYMDWGLGLSGNLNFTNNSLENYTTTSIFMTGSKSFTRANINNNTAGGGEKFLVVSGAATWLKNLAVNDNTISVATAIPAITIDRTNVFEVKDNIIDGNGTATFGVVVAATASSGLIGRNHIVNMTSGETQVSSTSTAKEYESAVFTPVFTFATPGDVNISGGGVVGRYAKRGNRVSVQIYGSGGITHTTAAGAFTITGLPVAAANVVNGHAVGSLSFSGITKANYTQFTPYVAPNGTSMIILASGSGQALSSVAAADIPSGGSFDIRAVLEYEVAN